MSCSSDRKVSTAANGRAELTFAVRDGRTVLADSRVSAPITLVRPFPMDDGGQLVQLITIGPGLCGGDAIHIRISVETGARVVVTTPAANRVLSMNAGLHAEQHVELAVADGGTLEYYPAVTIPFPDSAFVQTIRVDAAPSARVGVLETWALGRTSRDEYLQFRSVSSRTSLRVDGTLAYAEATELDPSVTRLEDAGVLAGRRYLASGFWYGATLTDETDTAPPGDADLVFALAQSRPGIAYLRALGSDAPALDAVLRTATDRIASSWKLLPVRLDRFRC
jgi:urease accessory protein UreH